MAWNHSSATCHAAKRMAHEDFLNIGTSYNLELYYQPLSLINKSVGGGGGYQRKYSSINIMENTHMQKRP
jgi:hypothetical protein